MDTDDVQFRGVIVRHTAAKETLVPTVGIITAHTGKHGAGSPTPGRDKYLTCTAFSVMRTTEFPRRPSWAVWGLGGCTFISARNPCTSTAGRTVMTSIPKVEANAKRGAGAVLDAPEKEASQIRCCYCKCSVAGCQCPGFVGQSSICENCGHAFHDHW